MALGKGKEKGENSGKSNKGILIILFVLGLIVIGGAAFGGTYLFMKNKATVEAKEVVIENTYMDLAEFTVNLAVEGGK
jgi:flagellar FliL protein